MQTSIVFMLFICSNSSFMLLLFQFFFPFATCSIYAFETFCLLCVWKCSWYAISLRCQVARKWFPFCFGYFPNMKYCSNWFTSLIFFSFIFLIVFPFSLIFHFGFFFNKWSYRRQLKYKTEESVWLCRQHPSYSFKCIQVNIVNGIISISMFIYFTVFLCFFFFIFISCALTVTVFL